MNKKNLQNFIQFLSQNKEATTKIKQLSGDKEALSAYVRELGYDFDPQELEEHQKKVVDIFKARVEKNLKKETPGNTPGLTALKQLMLLSQTDKAVEENLVRLSTAEPTEFIAYGREKGFIFDEKDMVAFANEIMESSDELSDEELELAAGGTTVVAISVVLYLVVGFTVGTALASVAAAGALAVVGVTALTSKGS